MAVKQYTRSGGAKSGAESYFIGIGWVLALGLWMDLKGLFTVIACMLAFQLMVMEKIDRFPFFKNQKSREQANVFPR